MSIRSAYSQVEVSDVKGYLDDRLQPEEFRDGEFVFWIEQARKSKGPVLDLASGAARVSMVLAKAGVKVVGLEASWFMLDIAKKAIASMPVEQQSNILLVQGDMFNFHFARLFPLIIVPFYSFWISCMEYRKESGGSSYDCAEQCLKCILSNLVAGGSFIIDRAWAEEKIWWIGIAAKLGFGFVSAAPYQQGSTTDVLIGYKF